MSTVDTSSWNPDADLNVEIEGISLNADAGIAQTWQALRVLMAAVKGDGDAIKAMIDVMQGATASADGASGLVPQPLAGDQDKVLKGDGTWGDAPTATEAESVPWSGVTGKPSAFTPSSHAHGSITNDGKLGTASRAVATAVDGTLAVANTTATELGYLSGVTSAIQTQLNAKAADNGVVHLDDAETVTGKKTFNQDCLILKSTAGHSSISTTGDSVPLRIWGGKTEAKSAKLILAPTDFNSSTDAGTFKLSATDGTNNIFLQGNSGGTLKWNGQTVQTSSDERLKTALAPVPDDVLDAWEAVQWGQFQFLDAVEHKGESARLHLGLIAQRVKAVFEEHGLDACDYGILCHEEHEAGEEEPAVDLWMVRYAEALAMEAAFQRRRADRLEARIKALEEKLK